MVFIYAQKVEGREKIIQFRSVVGKTEGTHKNIITLILFGVGNNNGNLKATATQIKDDINSMLIWYSVRVL